MSGELARAVREYVSRETAWIEADMTGEADARRIIENWSLFALPGAVGFVHANFVRRDERVPIPKRKP